MWNNQKQQKGCFPLCIQPHFNEGEGRYTGFTCLTIVHPSISLFIHLSLNLSLVGISTALYLPQY